MQIEQINFKCSSKIKILHKSMSENQIDCAESDNDSFLGVEREQVKIVTPVSKLSNKSSKAENLIGLVTHHIQDQISHNHINVAHQARPYDIHQIQNQSLVKNESQKLDEKKIAQFVKKRKSLEGQMARLKFQQEQEKKKLRLQHPVDESYGKTFRSHYTEQQQMQISRIKKQSEQFEHNLQIKDQQIANRLEQQRKRQSSQQKQHLERLKQKNKSSSSKNILKLHEEKKQRLTRLREQNKKLEEVKNGQSLHQKIEEYHKQLQVLKKEKQKEILIKKRKQMMIDFQKIKRHERQYYEIAKLQKQKLDKQMAEKARQMRLKQKQLNQTYRPSKFLTTIFRQEQQRQAEEWKKVQKVKDLFRRRKSYQQRLRSIHKQLIKPKPKPQAQKSPVQVKSDERRLKAKSLSAADIYKQGQLYMRQIHESISPVLVEKSKVQIQENFKSIKEGSKTQYKDYLKQSKLKREFFYKSTGQLNENPEIRELRALIKTKSQNAPQKLLQAKLIAQKLDEKAKMSSTKTIVNSIAAKIKIIEQFS